jgi:hypothetical protein
MSMIYINIYYYNDCNHNKNEESSLTRVYKIINVPAVVLRVFLVVGSMVSTEYMSLDFF